MKLLAIETSTRAIGVAVGGASGPGATMRIEGPPRHAEQLVPVITSCCSRAGVALAELDGIAVDTGPGLFTGLRVGVATAKALAFALGKQLVAVSSLDALAWSLRYAEGTVAAVLDARRGQCFWTVYRCGDGHARPLTEPAVDVPERVLAGLEKYRDVGAGLREIVAVGDGALRYGAVFGTARGVELGDGALAYPSPEGVLALGEAGASRSEWLAPQHLRATYLSDPDADPTASSTGSSGKGGSGPW